MWDSFACLMLAMIVKIWLLFVLGKILALERCRVPYLANGRSRVSPDGLMVRFKCRKFFQLMGPKYLHCIRGDWDAETPVCTRPGCKWNRNDYYNGLLLESYRGALVKVECYPGYTTGGPKAIYCDGFRWNGTFPECEPVTDEPAKSCDFDEDDFCGWIHGPSNKGYNWKLSKDQMGQSELDHTWELTDSSPATGQYIHVDSYRANQTSSSINITSRLYSPVYPPSFTSSVTCFSFWYFMRGHSAGLLKVYLLLQGHVVEETIPDFWVQGDQGPDWNMGIFKIEPPNSHFQVDFIIKEKFIQFLPQIVIEGVKNGGFDIAVDDVNIGFDSECEEKTTTEEDLSTTTDAFDSIEDFTCRNRCESSPVLINTDISPADLGETAKCECHLFCIHTDTCCEDFLEFCLGETEESVPTASDTTTEHVLTESSWIATASTRISTIRTTITEKATFSTSATTPTEKSVDVVKHWTLPKAAFNPVERSKLEKKKIQDSTIHEAILSNEPKTTVSLSLIMELSSAVAVSILVLAIIAVFIARRRKRANNEENTAEDSDVRLLTSDEFLDFTLARPSDSEC